MPHESVTHGADPTVTPAAAPPPEALSMADVPPTQSSKHSKSTGKKETPLMKQYYSIKAKYPETVLFFRMGDFFETFGEDAITTSRVTGIVLTKRGNGSASEIELAGFPHHQLDSYLPKMIRAGYRVAVCEQLEDPKLAKGIVERGVVEVVTPGVQTSEKLLEGKRNTYVGAVVLQNGVAGISYADVSTGEFYAGELFERELGNHLELIGISELLTARRDFSKFELHPALLGLTERPSLTKRDDWIFNSETSRELLLQHFKTASLKGFGLEGLPLATMAAGVVLDYLRETRGNALLTHVSRISRIDAQDQLILDASTRRNLEIFSPLRESSAPTVGDGKESSLIAVLDETSTPMGARLLRNWMARPTRKLEVLEQRLSAVQRAHDYRELRERLRLAFKNFGDLERTASRFVSARVLSPRDFLQIKFMLWKIPEIRETVQALCEVEADETQVPELLRAVAAGLDPLLQLSEMIDVTIAPDPPATLSSLGIIRDGANAELDELRSLATNNRQRLLEIQMRERERTSIPSLKVDFNNVFGYYIEVTKTHAEKVPIEYERRQTMTNAERYVTPELKEHEAKILGAEDRMRTLELQIIEKLRALIVGLIEPLQRNSQALALCDVLVTFSALASRNRWVRPTFTDGPLRIFDGRHPVVESLLPIGERFTPNSVEFEPGEREFYVITGPNMSGKSVFLRQTGIIAYLGHIGSFVPAAHAALPLLDRIFTRVGASDNLAFGESTFLVEMNEAANILNNATPSSLLLFDELGRGTSTFDGISIAWAIAEYINEHLAGARTLFATHYHELNALADRNARVKNLKVEVREAEGKIHFLHKITEGFADHSYGIEVAAMAGVPHEVIQRAREILASLEETELRIATLDVQREIPFPIQTPTPNLDARPKRSDDAEVVREVRAFDVEGKSPIEVMLQVAEWKRRLLSSS